MYMPEGKILPTKYTPEVSFSTGGIIEIRGRSMIGKITDFSNQVEELTDRYISNPADLTSVDFYLEYLDAINLKIYFSLVKKIESLKSKNKNYIINWYYEEGDEDILEKGEYLSSVLAIPFNFIEIYESIMP
jgi:hypothetical protein